MKRKVAVLLILMGLIVSRIHAQDISITGVREMYKKGDTIQFKIRNKLDHDIAILGISLMVHLPDDSWFDVIPDIFSTRCNQFMGVECFMMKGKQEMTITWDPKKMSPNCFNYKVYTGRFYIRVKKANSLEDKEWTDYASIDLSIIDPKTRVIQIK